MSAPPGDNLTADLNPAQRQVVLHGEGPLLVVAGPGSGKTTVLTRRAARLVALGEEPRAILLITFTTAARDEMRRRLAALLPAGSQADVSTFHGLCYRLVRAHHPERVRGLLDGSGQRRLVGRLLMQLARERRRQGAVPPDADAAALDQALTDLSRLRNAGLRATDPGAPTPQGLRRDDLAALAAAYATVKEEQGTLDFDDLLWEALDILDDPALQHRCRERWRHVLVDELQDVNRPQWAMLCRLRAPAGNLCAVGDPDQAIYGFRGASPEHLLGFARDFPGATRVVLDRNYRSLPAILARSNAVITRNRQRIAFAMHAAREEQGQVRGRQFDSSEDEAAWVARDVAARVGPGGVPAAEVAVVYRTTAYPFLVLQALEQAGLPLRVLGGVTTPFAHPAAQDVLAYLRLAAGERDAALLRRIANRPARYISGDALAKVAGSADPVAALATLPGLPGWVREPVRRLQDGLRRCAALPPQAAIALIRGDLGYDAYLRSEGDAEAAAVVEEAQQAAAAQATLPAFLDWVRRVGERARAAAGHGDEAGVTLTTTHSAKGLEFRAVYVLGCQEGHLPHRRSAGTLAGVEEERRLFYVALTRAKDEAVCTWVGEASRFLVEAGLAATGAAAKGGGGTASRAHPSRRGRAAEGAGLAAGAPGTQRTPDATPTVLGLSRCRALAAFCACGPRAQGDHRFRPGERACPRCGAARERCAQPVAQDGLCAHHLRRGPAEAVGGAMAAEEHAPPR